MEGTSLGVFHTYVDVSIIVNKCVMGVAVNVISLMILPATELRRMHWDMRRNKIMIAEFSPNHNL